MEHVVVWASAAVQRERVRAVDCAGLGDSDLILFYSFTVWFERVITTFILGVGRLDYNLF